MTHYLGVEILSMSHYNELKLIESANKKGVEISMGTIICPDCQRIIEHFEDEKVSTLYGTKCPTCNDEE